MKLRNLFYVKNLDSGREMTNLMSTAEEDPKYFVLSPERDPAALAALITYVEFCEPELAKDLEGWISDIKQAASKGESQLGSNGAVNAQHLMRQKADRLDDEAREHTIQHADNLKGGSPWPKISFLLGIEDD